MELNRRGFIKGAALGGATAIAGTSVALADVAQVGGVTAEQLGGEGPVVEELAFPGDTPAPETTAYTCDVLVIGCGWAGIHAAVTAARAGKSVVVADKGRPGYSGLSPFSQGCTYYDADYDNLEATLKALPVTADYLANINAFEHTLQHSKEAYEQNYEFGFTGGYLYAPASGYTEYSQDKEYFQANLANERHHKWMEVLEAEGVTVVPNTMITRLITADHGRACGAMGLHYKSATPITFQAKAVALCAGSGTYKASGVYCGWDVRDGATPIPGLYVAGDGEFGDMAEGVIYPFIGSTSTNCSVQGNMAGAAAAAYADTVEIVDLPADQVEAATSEIFAPRELTKGWDPNYVVDRLLGIMSAPEVQLAKDGVALSAALTQVEYLRDKVVPKMMGYCGHDLRYVLEAKHKVFSAEMKLSASLAREETRGTHYRSDFPFRDDANFLCHLGAHKAEDGSMAISKIEIPDSWKGDLSLDYATRYPGRFPGEAEAMGLEEGDKQTSGAYEHTA